MIPHRAVPRHLLRICGRHCGGYSGLSHGATNEVRSVLEVVDRERRLRALRRASVGSSHSDAWVATVKDPPRVAVLKSTDQSANGKLALN
jgi:hypothetical protein